MPLSLADIGYERASFVKRHRDRPECSYEVIFLHQVIEHPAGQDHIETPFERQEPEVS